LAIFLIWAERNEHLWATERLTTERSSPIDRTAPHLLGELGFLAGSGSWAAESAIPNE
jgi:hypothetical protein